MTKKVLVVCQHYWPESFRINDITEYLIEHGYSVDVLCGLPNYPKGQFYPGYGYFKKRYEVYKNVRIYRSLEIKRGDNSNFRIFINYISFPMFSLFKLPRLLTGNYDHVFIYQLSPVMMSITGILISKIKRIPSTLYVLDLWPENLFSVLPINNRVLSKLLTVHSHWYYKKADQLVVLSKKMQDKLITVTGKPIERIKVLPQACEKIYEKTIFDTVLKKRFEKKFTILFTGNISPAQDFPTMIRAAEIIIQKGFEDVHWIIVGDGMSRKDVELMISARGLEKYFSFEGFRPIEEIPKYTHVADVLLGCLVKSSLLEATIPAKVMSYIASGKPIVLAMDGEVQTLINETIRCGYAGPTQDAESLAHNILQVRNLSEDRRAEMGKRAKKYHFEHLERNVVLSKLVSFMFRS